MTRRTRRRSSLWRVALLVVLIGAAIYVNQVVVPTTPPLFIPTPTSTRSPESYVNQAEEAYKAGKFPESIEAYKKAIASDPNNPANYVALARVQVFAGNYEDALTNAQNALLKNPNNPMALAVQGWTLGFLGKYGEAELAIKKSLALDANSPLAHAYYAEILVDQNNPDVLQKAIDESNIAKSLDPNLLETRRARGIVLMNTNNLNKAVDEFKAAIAINKNIPDLQHYLGITYKALGDFDLAEEAMLSAYALNPKDTGVLTDIAYAYFADGKYRQAAQYAEEAVKIDPSDPRLHGNLGIMDYKNEEFSKAISEMALVVKGGTTADGTAVEGLPLDYEVDRYYYYYGFALAKSNRCAEAVPVFQALLNGVPDDQLAIDNANAGLDLCKQNLTTPSPEAGAKATPTPKS